MKISLNIRPVKITASNKRAIMLSLRNSADGFFSEQGNILYNYHTKTFRLYNLHKVNSKYQQEKYKTGVKKGQTKKRLLDRLFL